MSEVNIRLLASELNLSISTISKALRDSHEISKATKIRVLEAARIMHYSPNPYASSLRRKKSNTIAVVIPEVADSYFSQAINGIEDIAREKGYHVIIYLTHESAEREASILEDLGNGRVDGILISVSSETSNFETLKALHEKNVPVVFFDRVCDEIPTATVATNDFESGYAATQHLWESGCRNIAFLTIANHLNILNKRLLGYQKALEDLSPLQPQKSMLVSTGTDALAHQEIKKCLKKKQGRPDGIIASVEKLAMPVYLACQELDLNIPQDLKLICFSNQSTVSILNPSLTTITQPAYLMGKAAADALFRALTKKNFRLSNLEIILPSELIVRGSTSVYKPLKRKSTGTKKAVSHL